MQELTVGHPLRAPEHRQYSVWSYELMCATGIAKATKCANVPVEVAEKKSQWLGSR